MTLAALRTEYKQKLAQAASAPNVRDKAFYEGAFTGTFIGRSALACPYLGELKTHWLNGFSSGKARGDEARKFRKKRAQT